MQGAELFASQISCFGYAVTIDGEWIEFDYVVDGGTFEGKNVKLAILVPPNFPAVPPGGIDFTPRLRQENTSAEHPHRSHPSRRFENKGEYWSRPHPQWNSLKIKDGKAYMAWVRNLWITT